MKSICLSIMLLTIAYSSKGQESMMQDVSYPYLDKLVSTAKENYPKFKWTTARVNAAKAGLSRAKLGYLDFITFTYIYNPNNTVALYENGGTSGTTTTTAGTTGTSSYYNNNSVLKGYQLGFYINVGGLVEKPAMIKMAKEDVNIARYDKDVVDMNIEALVQQRYFVYIEEMNIVRVKTKNLNDADDMLKTVKYKFEKGETTFDVYNLALISYSNYTQEKINAEATELVAKSSLEELLGTQLENIK